MAEPTFPQGTPETPLCRMISAAECSENWASVTGFRNAWGVEFYDGTAGAWVRQYFIYGTGAPSTNYDTGKTVCSKYWDYDSGSEWNCIENDSGTLEWAPVALCIRSASNDTTAYTIHPQGLIKVDTDDNSVEMKISAAGADADATLT